MIGPGLRRIGLGIVVAITALVGLAVALVTLLHLPPGERWLAGKIEESLLQQIEVDNLAIDWPFTVRADYLRLRDGDGTWATATRPYLAWDPLRLWRRVLDIERLSAERIDIARLPRDESAEAEPLHWPKGTLNLGGLSAPVVLAEPVLGERVALDIAGTFQMRGGGGLVDIHLRSEGGELARLAGTAGRDYLDLRWYLRVPRLERWARLAGLPLAGEVEGSGLVAGRLPAPVLSGTVTSGPGQVGGVGWDGLTLTARLTPERALWRVGLTAEARSPRLDHKARSPRTDHKARSPRTDQRPVPFPLLSLSAAGDLAMDSGRLRLGMARLAGDGALLTASGVIEDWGRKADLRLSAALDDLSGLVPVAGRGGVRASLAGDLLAPDLGGRIEAWTDRFSTGIAIVDRLLGPRPKALSQVHLGPDGSLTLADGAVFGKGGTLGLDGRLKGTDLALWARLGVPDLHVLADGLNGRGVVWGRVGGTVNAPRLAGVARLDSLVLGQTPSAEGMIGFDLVGANGTLTADLRVAGRPVEGRARLVGGSPTHLRDLVLASQGARLAGDLAFEKGGVRGRLNGIIPELKPWQDLLGPLAGRVEADAVLDPAARQTLRLDLRGSGLAVSDVVLGEARATIEATELNARPQVRFALDGGSAALGVDLGGSARLADGIAELDRLSLRRKNRRLDLARPTRLEWARVEWARVERGPAVVLAPTLLTIGGGRITLEGRLSGQTIAAKAELAGVPLDLVELFIPRLDAVGVADGTLIVEGTLAAPVARLDLKGRRVGFAAAARAGLGRMAVALDGEWRDGRAQVTGRAEDGQRFRLAGKGDFPLPFVPDGRVYGAVEVAGDVARLAESLPLAGHVFAGRIEGDAQLSGTLGQPRIDGGATIAQGRYENLENGTLVADLTGRLGLDGDRLSLEAGGSDGGRGRVRLRGEGGLDGSWRGDVALERFTALRRDDVEAVADGRLELSGRGGDGRIAGSVTLPRAEIDIGRLKGAGPVTIEVVEINRPGQAVAEQGDIAPEEEEGEGAPVRLALDVQLAIEHAFVRGRGLDSEWQGKLAVGGMTAEPSLNGRLVAARGDYQFLGKSFRLTPDSAVSFEGGDPADPTLAVAATARAADITARVEVTGSGRDPSIAITSEPPLPQDEVLARVLFGREAGKLSAFQQIQLAQMAASGLTGGGGGFDPIGDVRGLLGLDVLDVGGETAGGPTLSAGKYIGRDTFVRVEQGTQGVGSVTVEQDLGRGFAVETEIGQQTGGGVGLSWRRDY